MKATGFSWVVGAVTATLLSGIASGCGGITASLGGTDGGEVDAVASSSSSSSGGGNTSSSGSSGSGGVSSSSSGGPGAAYPIACPPLQGPGAAPCGQSESPSYILVEWAAPGDAGIESCECVPAMGGCSFTGTGAPTCTCALCGPDPAQTLFCGWDAYYNVPTLLVCKAP